MEQILPSPLLRSRLSQSAMKFFGPSTGVLGVWILIKTFKGVGPGGWPLVLFQSGALFSLGLVYFGVHRLTQAVEVKADSAPWIDRFFALIIGGATCAYIAMAIQLMFLIR